MNMFRTFMELDKLDEGRESYDRFRDRQELINKIKALGRQYYFDKYSSEQLYNIWQKESAKQIEQDAWADYYKSRIIHPTCSKCGCNLTDGGYCPKCNDGAEDLDESIFNNTASRRSNWTKMASNSAGINKTTQINNANTSNNIITIVKDGSRLRAKADDGSNGPGFVAFPNHLRQSEGQQYEVETLIWNGKNYRIAGDIKLLNSVSNTQNINETTNKENFKMNLTNVFEELDRLYESDVADDVAEISNTIVEEVSEEAPIDEAVEAPAEEESMVDEEPVAEEELAGEEEPAADEPKQLVLECSKCGALIVKDELDVLIDSETDLANIEEACAFCEAAEGFKVIGILAPYEASEELEEGLSSNKSASEE